MGHEVRESHRRAQVVSTPTLKWPVPLPAERWGGEMPWDWVRMFSQTVTREDIKGKFVTVTGFLLVNLRKNSDESRGHPPFSRPYR